MLTSRATLSKNPEFMLLTCLLPFLVTKGPRVLEKKVNETPVSKTVFSHLKLCIYNNVHVAAAMTNHVIHASFSAHIVTCKDNINNPNWLWPVKIEHHIALLHSKSVVEFFIELEQNVILAHLEIFWTITSLILYGNKINIKKWQIRRISQDMRKTT